MTVTINLQARHLAVVGAVVAAAVVFVVWWAAPASSQAAGPDAVDTFAVVARADNPVDALAASSVAGQLGAPVFLTGSDSLGDQARQGLVDTGPDVVVLAGGTAALSQQVEADVAGLLPDADVRRFGGADRTETARLVNQLPGQLGVVRPVVAGATVTGDVGIDGHLTVDGLDIAATLHSVVDRIGDLEDHTATLEDDLAAATGRIDSLEGDLAAATRRIDTLEGDLAAATGRIDSLESDNAALTARVDSLEATLAGVTRTTIDGHDTLRFEAMNLQIVNGEGATYTTNGLGNLIVGYNEDHTTGDCQPSTSDCQYLGDNTADARTGSHTVVVGVDHTWTSYGGLLAGLNNTTSGIFASVAGGFRNVASGQFASVTGGQMNTASGWFASVSGGRGSTASGDLASVASGEFNIASGFGASVSGGRNNTASGFAASVSGGEFNIASGVAASVAGGRDGTVSDSYDSRIGNNDFPDG